MMVASAAMDCLDDNDASEFASGSMAGETATRVERHLASCRDCRQLVAALAPMPGEGDAESDVITAPRRVPLGKRGRKVDVAIAPTERPAGATVPARPRDPVVIAGDTIGRYIILARLGAGGMGVVFTAYDPQLDRKVALKLLRTGSGLAEGEARARLVREAQAIAQLSHPNVVAVYDVGTADSGDVYIAMEFVEGETLTSWLGHWERSWREILEMFFQAGRGLAAAHARGLMHRDFKPDNVLVGLDGRVRVTDFGLARSVIDHVEELSKDRPRPDLAALRVTLTATGAVLGTPRYMAPEQLRGATADARSDQFSFCIALYEALYGTHPLPGDSVIEMVQHGAEPTPPPVDTKVPPSIGRTLMRGLSIEPVKRYSTMSALLVELTPPPVIRGRRRWTAALAAVALVAGGAAAATVMRGDDRGRIDELQRQLDDERAEAAKLRDELTRALDAPGGIRDRKAQIQALEQKLAATERKVEELQVKLNEASPLPTATVDPLPPVRPPARHVDAGPPVDAAPHGLDDDAFSRAAEAKLGQIDSCIGEWQARKPDQNGTIFVSLTIGADGVVQRATARGLASALANECVEGALRQAVFPPAGAVTTGQVKITTVPGEPSVMSAWTTGARDGKQIDL